MADPKIPEPAFPKQQTAVAATDVAPVVVWKSSAADAPRKCAGCAERESVSRGLCRSCYDAAYHDESCFGGNKQTVLEREGHQCRVCQTPTDVVHHRKPGVNDPECLITLCPACHARVDRSLVLPAFASPLLSELWQEKHPGQPWQMPLVFEEAA